VLDTTKDLPECWKDTAFASYQPRDKRRHSFLRKSRVTSIGACLRQPYSDGRPFLRGTSEQEKPRAWEYCEQARCVLRAQTNLWGWAGVR
jgi:hypothetical protein